MGACRQHDQSVVLADRQDDLVTKVIGHEDVAPPEIQEPVAGGSGVRAADARQDEDAREHFGALVHEAETAKAQARSKARFGVAS